MLRDRLLGYIGQNAEALTSFLRKLISTKPVNPATLRIMGLDAGEGELPAQLWLEERLRAMGFDRVEKVAVDRKRPNVVAVIKGDGGGRSLILNGHVDVAPVTPLQAERWTVDPWEGRQVDGRIVGRGSSDMLSGIAAMIWSAAAVVESGARLGGDLILQCVAGEESNEGGTIGTAAVVDAGYRADFAIVCEPTSMEVQPVTNGTLLFQMIVRGKENHTGTKNMIVNPQPYGVPHGDDVGVDAIDKMLKFLSAFRELERRWNFKHRHPLLGSAPDQQGVAPFTLTTTLLEGGTYIAAIPGHSKATFQIYYPPTVTAKQVWHDVKRTVEAVCSADDWLSTHPPSLLVDKSVEGSLDVFPVWEPNQIPVDHEGCQQVISSYEAVTGRRPTVSGMKAVCDATYLGKKGIPAVVLGPGDLHANCHGPDEWVDVESIVKCSKVYVEMITRWCGLV